MQSWAGFLSLPLAGGFSCSGKSTAPTRHFQVPGTIANAGAAQRGHLLRDNCEPSDFELSEMSPWDVIVIGGGISGLAAMWKLKKAGVDRILLLELESQVGGTCAWSDEAGGFPWGAHYINIPPREADCIHELLGDLGVITGYDAAGRPRVNPDDRIGWPRERLHMAGRWIEDLDPFEDASASEREQFLQFEDDMLRHALTRGIDGRRAFSMPVAYSSRDSSSRALDELTFIDYVRQRGWDGKRLDWYLNYACRDDYGSHLNEVSAWAGIHYFACRDYDRRIASEYPTDTLSWAEGNGYLVKQLLSGLEAGEVRTDTAVVGLHTGDSGIQSVACIDVSTGERYRLLGRNVVFAGKLHAAPFVIRDLDHARLRAFKLLKYSPWLVAAVRVSAAPAAEFPAAWDNVIFDSRSLGYVDASHQREWRREWRRESADRPRERGDADGRVLVYYYPFVENPDQGRNRLLAADHGHWVDLVMNDLMTVHPDLEGLVESIDVWRWGHAMVKPLPGQMWGAGAALRRLPQGSTSFASCDAGGLPLFEEAVFAGTRAAEECLNRLEVNFETSLYGIGHG